MTSKLSRGALSFSFSSAACSLECLFQGITCNSCCWLVLTVLTSCLGTWKRFPHAGLHGCILMSQASRCQVFCMLGLGCRVTSAPNLQTSPAYHRRANSYLCVPMASRDLNLKELTWKAGKGQALPDLQRYKMTTLSPQNLFPCHHVTFVVRRTNQHTRIHSGAFPMHSGDLQASAKGQLLFLIFCDLVV